MSRLNYLTLIATMSMLALAVSLISTSGCKKNASEEETNEEEAEAREATPDQVTLSAEALESLRLTYARAEERDLAVPEVDLLDAVLVGDDVASSTYVRMKQRMCEDLGIYSAGVTLPADSTQEEVEAVVAELHETLRAGWRAERDG